MARSVTHTRSRIVVDGTPGSSAPATAEPTHQEIVEVLVGLMSALFVAIVSATIVSTALPTIIADLQGSQTQYTWVVTASLLAMTVSSPVWSKLSDLYNKKILVQVAIGIFLLGTLAAGAAQNVPELLAARAVQGLGMGGLVALAQSILGSIIPPRQRGRYSGYLAGTMAVATVSGPLLGGLVVDVAGWRWCFWIMVPFALLAMGMLQRFLHLETVRRPVRLDYWGALLIALAASLPLIWVSFAGRSFDWWSLETVVFLAVSLAALAAAVVVERRHVDALVPASIIGDPITRLAILGSLAVGVAQYGGSVFLAQYFQIARNHTPTEAGLLMLPLIVGNLVGATGSGHFITRTGRWKGIMLLGSATLVVGMSLMGTVDSVISMWHLGGYMLLMGLGTGALMQNLVLVVQNTVDVTDVGAASGVVSFFRSLGGTVGVAALGAALAGSVSGKIASGLATAGLPQGSAGASGSLDLDALTPGVAAIVRAAYADATGRIFLVAGVISVLAFIAVALMPVTELRTTIRKVEEPAEPTEPTEPAERVLV